MHSETISVIIPVYNAEGWLVRCVESVLAQSYRNLEVLLVDDGSMDSSGEICDRWAERDSRIRVIHKENGGVSAARNTGLAAATGDYLAFADSDDYLAGNMLEMLHTALTVNNADISICNIQYVDENGGLLGSGDDSPIQDEVLTGPEAVFKSADCYHKGWYYQFVWNKLFKASLFSGLRFPDGKISEEDFITHRLYMRSSKIACTRAVGYYYVQRPESLVNSRSSKLFLNRAEGSLVRATDCEALGLSRSAGLSYWMAGISLVEAYTEKEPSPEIRKYREDVLSLFRDHIHLYKYCTLKERLQMLAVLPGPRLYQTIFRNPLKQKISNSFPRRTAKRAGR